MRGRRYFEVVGRKREVDAACSVEVPLNGIGDFRCFTAQPVWMWL